MKQNLIQDTVYYIQYIINIQIVYMKRFKENDSSLSACMARQRRHLASGYVSSAVHVAPLEGTTVPINGNSSGEWALWSVCLPI